METAARWVAVARLFWLQEEQGQGQGQDKEQKARGDKSRSLSGKPSHRLVRPRKEAWLRLAAVLALQIVRGKAATVLAAATRDVLTAAGTDHFSATLTRKLGLLLLLSPLDAFYEHVLRGLRAAWSTCLTSRLLRDYVDLACARLRPPEDLRDGTDHDPAEDGHDELSIDQHVAEGVDKFVNLSLDLLLESVQAAIHLYFFTRMLTGPSRSLATTSQRLAVLGTASTLFVGKSLPSLYRLEREATNDFRYALTRVLDNAESIAFYDGAAQEVETLRDRHLTKLSRGWERSQQRDLVQMFSSTFRKVAGLLPFYLVLAQAGSSVSGSTSAEAAAAEALLPAHGHSHASSHGHSHASAHAHAHAHDHSHACSHGDDNGSAESPASVSSQLAAVLQASEAFDEVLFHLMILAENINDFSRLKAVTDQLHGMLRSSKDSHLDELEKAKVGNRERGASLIERTPQSSSDAWLELNEVTLQYRDRVLVSRLNIVLQGTDRLLITGGSGFGKTSLLRCIQGLAMNGAAGTITRPFKDDIMFIPQQPYMTLGSLREQLFYPTPRDEVPQHRDAEAMRVLHVVGLSHLEGRCPEGLDTVLRWSDELSVGEQQRIAFCRISLRKPRFVFLDEATSALDMAAEARMHQLLASSCQAYVSVGHRVTIESFHSHKLTLHGAGRWDMSRIAK
ncbi:ABC efflux transporter ATP-binding protein [Hondaea fermentalgiana]|uniref:ABC efflux transporter ATP-binding protein n=1 Tax=Hondaea fermentalgiana TaxID=2315210 RepID=A0A2R5GA23_9STRA|nr:ABC efflux transporter ATP-binding protein [Hondaea fermentalgiana]|eukprot:GBG27872.1 ABC efflux transporter ATP-binding protein [Hondaea fermentalgiana]